MPPLPDQDRIDEREGVARIIDSGAFISWGYMLPPNVQRRELALIKADAILALLRTTHD